MSAVLQPTQTEEIASEAELEALLSDADNYSDEETQRLLEVVENYKKKRRVEAARRDLIQFCKRMQSDYKVGKHHRILGDLLMEIEQGREYDYAGKPLSNTGKDRICVNMPPRHGKSQLVSIYFPAWFLGRNPDKKVLMVSHTTDLAVDFGRKVRNLIGTPQYQEIFPNTKLAVDSKSAGRWNTSEGGEYFACGVGSALAGRGAHLLLVDDPHNEQDIINGNLDVFDKAYEWFTFGARTRLMPGGRVAIIQTRWHLDDLTGRVTRDMAQNELSDKYEIVEFPAILDVNDKEKPLWPEFFNLDALHRTKASMPLFQWNAQYQQEPTAEEAALVKREWWKEWKDENPPQCEYLIMSLDAAAEKHNRADYTAITTWGVFHNDEEGRYEIILLNSIKQRLEFPELKELSYKEYMEWEPDAFIVEKKGSGTPLYQEFRRMGLVVQEYTPHRGSGDKMARLNSVADIIKSGLTWVPQTRWAEELVEEVAGFPFMSNDDLVDATVMALMRFRQGGFIRLPTDEPDEVQYFKQRRGGDY